MGAVQCSYFFYYNTKKKIIKIKGGAKAEKVVKKLNL